MNPLRFTSAVLFLLSMGACAGAPSGPGVRDAVDGHGLVGQELYGDMLAVDQSFDAGKYVTLVYWQPWCETCLTDGPWIEIAKQKYADRIDFYGVVAGEDQTPNNADLKATVEDLGLTYPQIRDRDGSWSRRFEIIATPTFLVFSPSGTLRYRGRHMPGNWDELIGE